MSYLAADSRIVHRLASRHGPRGNLLRLNASNLTWAVENPFPTCTVHVTNECSCKVVQEIRKMSSTRRPRENDTLGSWQNGAIIFGNRSYRPKKRKNSVNAQRDEFPIQYRGIIPADTVLHDMIPQGLAVGPILAENHAQDDVQIAAIEENIEPLSPRDQVRQHWGNIEFQFQAEEDTEGLVGELDS